MKKGLFRLQYELEDETPYTERGSDAGAKLCVENIENDEVRHTLQHMATMGYKEKLAWLIDQSQSSTIAILSMGADNPDTVRRQLEQRSPDLLFISRPLHTIELLDKYLYAANAALPEGAYLWCHSMTAVLRRKLLLKRYKRGVGDLLVLTNYFWHRVCPKLKLTHKLYFALTGGKKRLMNRVEMIGRLYRAGFEVVDEKFSDGEFFAVARKVKEPMNDPEPTGSPIIHLRRIGKGGKEIVVHKFRTMYTYSEYVQPYIYHYQSLERGGKFKDDYRVNFWGRFLRKVWLDELPMVWNMIRGDLKLVGVRPLSRQYFSLYTPEMQELRTKTKPGLLPPFYYEAKTPETIEEVQESERRYLEAYLEAPFKTDWKYFWGIVGNILFRRKRSK
jgi:hypothetical protein